MRRRSDGGQVSTMLLAVVAMCASVGFGVAWVGGRLLDAADAQAAADAAALAGTTGGRSAADELAQANGAALVDYRVEGDSVVVVVEVDGTRATARATDAP